MELGVIDDFTLDLDEAIEQADILVICYPHPGRREMLEQILPRLAGRDDGPVITDAASVKGSLRERDSAWRGYAAATGAGAPDSRVRAQWCGRVQRRPVRQSPGDSHAGRGQ